MKPIIMSTEDVRGILDGRKTMGRKLITNGTPYYDGDALCFAEKKGPHYGPSLAIGWSPYKPGDVLWVRETWSPVHVLPKRYLYKADAENGGEGDGLPIRWRPSIHMPREAARLFLRVKDVRVERVKEITLDDIEREGLYCDPPYTREHFAYGPGMSIHWVKLWDSINAKRNGGAYAYDKNPWVWVYSFERVDKPAG